jgi:hypothetical protein
MNKAFESRVRRTGQRLFQLMGDEVPPLFQKESWTGKVIAHCAKKEGFKSDFLRFMDVLPSLKHAESVAQYLTEYFGRPEQQVPAGLRLHFKKLCPASLKRTESVSRAIQEMMKKFIAAAGPREALPTFSDLRGRLRTLALSWEP